MAVTRFQSEVLRLLADQRIRRGESYVAGGVALNILLDAARRSRDIDLFHDTQEALEFSWSADRDTLASHGFDVRVLRDSPSFVEVIVERSGDRTVLQWVRDSVFRFFPLLEDDLMGLTLHPFDLATNKVLAMAGRLEVRDWVDVLNCDERLQPFGLLVWAACGKDPGYNPRSLLAAAGRLHYSQAEVDTLDFDGTKPDAVTLGKKWHAALAMGEDICAALPACEAGKCVITRQGELFRGAAADLADALSNDTVCFHAGQLKGSWPSVVA